MSDDNSALRIRLIERICRLPAESLAKAEGLLASLEREKSGDKSPHSKEKDWPHAPLHRLSQYGTYIVTAGTLRKEHLFASAPRLDFLETTLLALAKQHGWQLEAWAVFSNHYHFVGHAGEGSLALRDLIKHFHADTARCINAEDGTAGRIVWHNYWDTQLTFEKSYQARLNYVHQNAVRHGLVTVANQYRWCSAAWFERTATRAQVKTIYSFKTDKVRVEDDFEVLPI